MLSNQSRTSREATSSLCPKQVGLELPKSKWKKRSKKEIRVSVANVIIVMPGEARSAAHRFKCRATRVIASTTSPHKPNGKSL